MATTKTKFSRSKITREKNPTKVYSFRCRIRGGHETLDALLKQYRNVYNAIIDAKNETDAARLVAIGKLVPGYKDLHENIERLRDEAARKGTDFKESRAAARAELRELYPKMKELAPLVREAFDGPRAELMKRVAEESKGSNGRVHPGSQARNKAKAIAAFLSESDSPFAEYLALENAADERRKSARRGCHAQTATLAKDAATQAIGDSFRKRKRRCRPGSGRVGLEFNPPVPVAALFAGTREFKIGQLPESERRLTGTKCHVPAEVAPKGFDPIPVTIIQHRRFPVDALVSKVVIVAKKNGLKVKHFLQFSIESAEFKESSCGTGSVAINFGWKRTAQGAFQVAYCVDDEGNEHHVTVPEKAVNGLDHASSLRSISERIYEQQFKAEFWSLAKEIPSLIPRDVLEFQQQRLVRSGKEGDALASLRQMKAHRFAGVASHIAHGHFTHDELIAAWKQWKEHRFKLGLDLYASASDTIAWATSAMFSTEKAAALWVFTFHKKFFHLDQVGCNKRAESLANRKDHYRFVARMFANTYEFALVDDSDWSQVARRKKPDELASDEDKAIAEQANANRFTVCPSEFRGALQEAFLNKLIRVKSENISKIHFGCGGRLKPANKADRAPVCPKCGEYVEIDKNACAHLLNRGTAALAAE